MNAQEQLNRLLADVRLHCSHCMSQANGFKKCQEKDACRFWKWVSAPTQIDVFQGEYKQAWFRETFEVIESMPKPFYFSDLRRRLAVAPAHVNWFGNLTKFMMRAGYHTTGLRRKSPLPQCKGRREDQWTK